MQIHVEPGKYVVAVSGGVDSMVLLLLLHEIPAVELVVAHFDHGIREDSYEDRGFVEAASEALQLPFKFAKGKLGPDASEATAREARYSFLREVQQQHNAQAIITAHHQDDAIETAILNLARGTGRRGLTALGDSKTLLRPLLNIPKADLLAYAKEHNITWREDSSNANQKYLRNYIRNTVLPRFSKEDRAQFVQYITNLRLINKELDSELANSVKNLENGESLNRQALATAPPVIIKELLAAWWRANGFRSYETKTLQRALHDVRHGQTRAIIPLKGDYYMALGREELALHKHER